MLLNQYAYLLLGPVVLVIIVFIFLRNRKIHYNIVNDIPEKWIPYLSYAMDLAYDVIYAKHLATYMASNTMMRAEDKEFAEMSRNFFMMIKLYLGKTYESIYLKHIFLDENQFVDYINSYLITKVYRDLAGSVISENQNEQNINEERL